MNTTKKTTDILHEKYSIFLATKHERPTVIIISINLKKKIIFDFVGKTNIKISKFNNLKYCGVPLIFTKDILKNEILCL